MDRIKTESEKEKKERPNSHKPKDFQIYKKEKKLLENYLQNPEKTKLNQENILKRCLEKYKNHQNNDKKLFFLSNPEKIQKKDNSQDTKNPFYKKISEIQSKLNLHRSYNWESLIPIPNDFLNKKDLGLNRFYKNPQKETHKKTIKQIKIFTTPIIDKTKSPYTPKMSLQMMIRKAYLGSTQEKTPKNDDSSLNFKKEIRKEIEEFSPIEEESSFKREEGKVTKNVCYKKNESILQELRENKGEESLFAQKDLSKTFEYEKMIEYKQFLNYEPLREEEKFFFHSIKNNDITEIKKMLDLNQNYLKLRDQVIFLICFKFFIIEFVNAIALGSKKRIYRND